MRVPFALALLLAAPATSRAAARAEVAVSTESLLAELTDLGRLAEWPDPPFRCGQFSSYDRRSTSPTDVQGWFANADAGNFLRSEQRNGRSEYVMMDAAGPGAIVRIWSANPAGTLRFYLDDATEAAFSVPMRDLLGGIVPGVPPPIAGERSRGWNCFYPLAYRQRCVVTVDADDGLYYHVNYRTYPPGTPVRSFHSAELERCAAAAYAAAAALAFPRPPHDGLSPAEDRSPVSALAPGATSRAELRGPAAITGFSVRILGDELAVARRSTILRMTFDGETTVETPLSDFFGGGPAADAYAALPMGIDADGRMWSGWVMPFRDTAIIEFENRGTSAVQLRSSIQPTRRPWTDRSLYFHAHWRTARDVPTRPYIDWNYIDLAGRGVLVGAAFSILNPVRDWWGEGDEKIYIDDEVFPSTFGTGTEDYFGYAWCSPLPFTHAYHAQPRCDGPGNYGLTAVNRWHVLDRIPFERRLRFDMELWHWNATARVTMAVTTYAYAAPGATASVAAPSADDLGMPTLPPYAPPRVAGALEGEQFRIVAVAGRAQSQDIGGCSNDQHLWWRDGKVSDRLTVAFPAPQPGRHRVFLRRLQAPDYGQHRIEINGQPAVEMLDSYAPSIRPAAELDLGVFELRPENELTLTIVGANAEAIRSYMFGLDYVRLAPGE